MKDLDPPRSDAATELLVCSSCRMGRASDEGEERPGAALLARLRALDWPEGISLGAVDCLSNCARGCSVVLRGAGRWTYVYGGLDADLAGTLHEGALRYHATPDGLVPWRERPDHFRKNCIARIPPQEPKP